VIVERPGIAKIQHQRQARQLLEDQARQCCAERTAGHVNGRHAVAANQGQALDNAERNPADMHVRKEQQPPQRIVLQIDAEQARHLVTDPTDDGGEPA
jgi:hypothetical protein